jgi:hypothetical protein
MNQSVDGKKIFVLCTTVPLHDGDCLDKFDDNDIVVPFSIDMGPRYSFAPIPINLDNVKS